MSKIEVNDKILAIGQQLYDNNKEDVKEGETSLRNTVVGIVAEMITEGLQLYENSKSNP